MAEKKPAEREAQPLEMKVRNKSWPESPVRGSLGGLTGDRLGQAQEEYPVERGSSSSSWDKPRGSSHPSAEEGRAKTKEKKNRLRQKEEARESAGISDGRWLRDR